MTKLHSVRGARRRVLGVVAVASVAALTFLSATSASARPASSAFIPSDGQESTCVALAKQHHFVKAVCAFGGMYGVTQVHAKPVHVTASQVAKDLAATAHSVQPMDAKNGSIEHVLNGVWIEDTTATVSWIYNTGSKIYTGSYYVKLHTYLNGRQPIYSLYLTHKAGGTIIVGNMQVGCREDGAFPLVCDNLYPADQTLGSPLSWLNHKGNYLNNADPYHTSFNSHVEVFGDILPVGTLSSSQFNCPDKTGDSIADRCYF